MKINTIKLADDMLKRDSTKHFIIGYLGAEFQKNKRLQKDILKNYYSKKRLKKVI